MVGSNLENVLSNSCALGKEECINCHKHFLALRPLITEVVITKRFLKDYKDSLKASQTVSEILDCSNLDYYEMHKFEANIDGTLVFRSKKDGVHSVFVVDKQLRVIFLRSFKNYSEYGKFLEDKKEIRKMVASV